VFGPTEDGMRHGSVQITPDGTPGGNPAFDVTPARLVTGLITERGVAEASREGLLGAVSGAPQRRLSLARPEFTRLGGCRFRRVPSSRQRSSGW
jgi:hypothetical protein